MVFRSFFEKYQYARTLKQNLKVLSLLDSDPSSRSKGLSLLSDLVEQDVVLPEYVDDIIDTLISKLKVDYKPENKKETEFIFTDDLDLIMELSFLPHNNNHDWDEVSRFISEETPHFNEYIFVILGITKDIKYLPIISKHLDGPDEQTRENAQYAYNEILAANSSIREDPE